jgi:hypothetical protein
MDKKLAGADGQSFPSLYGYRSRSSNMLVDAGFSQIFNIPDGFPGWLGKGYPAQ